jgi:hypothetical protein
MTDYAAAPIQPILQGLVSIDQNGNPQFFGKGASAVARVTGQAAGVFQLTLDQGLPGNAGAIEPLPTNSPFTPPFPDDPDPRTTITIRGTGTVPGTTISEVVVSYGPGTPAPAPGVGDNTIFVSFATSAGVFTDPPAGFEIITWLGIGSSQLLPVTFA